MKKLLFRAVPVFIVISLLAGAIYLNSVLRTAGTAENKENDKEVIRLTPDQNGEMLAVWVPYMTLTMKDGEDSKQDFIAKFEKIISTSKDSGMNTLIVQVRPFCDALYKSAIFPYSHILTGNQGQNPNYDALEIMTEMAHKSGLAIHAWINPLRVQYNNMPKTLSPGGIYEKLKKQDDNNIIKWKSNIYLNPASPEVRKTIIDGVREIVENYAVDGIHFDDYFYPAADASIDKSSYDHYKKSLDKQAVPLTLSDWRKTNINVLISGVYSAVKTAGSGKVVFGISPQANISNNLNSGADVYTWGGMSGYADYLCPQIYVNFEHEELPFDKAADEWRAIVKDKNTKLYIGLAVYKAGSDADKGSWKKYDDIIKKEIEYGRKIKCDGFMLYSYDYLLNSQTEDEIANAMKVIKK